MSQASRDTLNRPQCPPQCLNALTAPDHASDNGRFRPLQLPTPVPPLVGSVGSIARQKAASGQPRIEMVCSACAACELWWGIAGLNGFQGSKFICHELWGVRAIIGKASSSETRPIRDTVDAQPGRQAQSRRVARLSTSLSRLQLCAVRTQGCTPSARAADGYTSIPLGRDSNHVNFVNQISTAQIRTPIRPAVSPCVLLLRSVATLDFKCEFANKYWLQQHRDQCFTSRGSAMEVGSYGMKWPTPGRRSVHSKCRNPLHEAVTCRPSEKARQWWSCNESLKQW